MLSHCGATIRSRIGPTVRPGSLSPQITSVASIINFVARSASDCNERQASFAIVRLYISDTIVA